MRNVLAEEWAVIASWTPFQRVRFFLYAVLLGSAVGLALAWITNRVS